MLDLLINTQLLFSRDLNLTINGRGLGFFERRGICLIKLMFLIQVVHFGFSDKMVWNLLLVFILIHVEMRILLVSTAVCRLFNEDTIPIFLFLILFDESRCTFVGPLVGFEFISVPLARRLNNQVFGLSLVPLRGVVVVYIGT